LLIVGKAVKSFWLACRRSARENKTAFKWQTPKMFNKALMITCRIVRPKMKLKPALTPYGQGLALLGDLKNVRPELKPN
jgi:hypothetical protein